MTADPELLAARARSVAARARLDVSVNTAKTRLNPKTLAGDAVDGVKTKAGEIALDGVEAVRSRPAVAAAALAAVGVVLARKPLSRWLGALFGYGDATGESDAS